MWKKSLSVTIQMDPTKQYFPVLLFITLYNFYLTFESVDDELQSVAGLSPNV